ncbi:MAG TPA: LysR substrate-binding domain-containing protein [Rhodocyclaceae bacterium]|nr:LysR substrate-binding domain-containing protein [Rhodocyclaceae bacterium]
MEIRQLKYFIAVAEEGNISRAAARLHISQPPLTRHIQTLEEDLGVQLFKRTNWGVELTQAGRLLLEHARNIKAHVELAAHQAQQVAKGQLGRIEVGVYGTAMLNVIPRILARFSASHPDVELILQSAPKGPQIEALTQGRIQLAFDRHLPESDEIAVELVDREPVMLALNKNHPLASQESIRILDLKGHALIGEMGQTYQRSAHLFQRHGFLPNFTQRAADMISAAILAASGFDISFAPASMATLQLPDLVYRPLEDEEKPMMLLHCAYRRNESNPLLHELLRTVREYRTAQGIEP